MNKILDVLYFPEVVDINYIIKKVNIKDFKKILYILCN